MMKRSILVTIVFLSFFIGASSPVNAQAKQMLGARYPTVSPDGSRIIATWNGDLWIAPVAGGEAQRLTDNVAYERNGVWSPDGLEIAFSSNRRGNYDIYVVSANGGSPRQITHSQANDYVCDWSKDGKLLFFSFQGFRGYQLYEVGVSGGMPTVLTLDDNDTSYACYTRQNDVIYTRGTVEWYRKGYIGSGNFDLWYLDRKAMKNKRLTEDNSNDGWPTMSGDTVYFASERDGMYNIYGMNANGGKVDKITNVREDGAATPSVSKDGDVLVYENAGRIYRINPKGGSASEVVIAAASDEKQNAVTKEIFESVDEYTLSLNGKYIAFVARGDIFVTYTDDAFPPDAKPDREMAYARRVTSDPSRDWQVNWHPDSDKIIFVSDRNGGQLDLFITDLRTMSTAKLTDSPDDDSWPLFSPDGKSVIYNRRGDQLVLINVDDHTSHIVDTGEVAWGPYGGWFKFSPDGKWLGYAKMIDGFNMDIFVAPIDESVPPVNITRHPDWVDIADWLPDGTGAIFMSDREENNWTIYKLDFKRKEKKFTDGFILDAPKPSGEQQKNGAETSDEGAQSESGEAPPAPSVEFDFDRIWERVTRVTNHAGRSFSPVVSPDSKWVYYLSDATGKLDLWAAALDGSADFPLGAADYMYSLKLSPAGDKLYYITMLGSIGYLMLNGPQIVGYGYIPISAAMKLDHKREFLQMYTECWRLMRNYFYDPDLHGARKDWDAIYQKYLPLVEQVTTHEEFYYIISDLLGDIRGSHLGIYGGSSFEGIPAYTGILGLDFDLSYAGPGLKISHVLRDGPCDQKESKVNVGEIVISIDGTPVDRSVDLYEMLDEKVADQVDLVVRGDAGERKVHVIALDHIMQYQLSYEEWVAQRREMTEKLSNGRVGYLHIQGMDWESFEKFKQDLFGLNFDKKAIVIDIRFNGGGWTHNNVLDLLTRKAFAFSKGRFTDWLGEPAMRWDRPAVCLINSSCYSDAEIFPYGFKKLGIGKVVGEPTHGSVIGTGEYPLVDGTGFRLPMEGWYTIDKRSMEVSGKNGVKGIEPDIYVKNLPDDVREGKDPQLEAAVRELLRELGS